MGDNLSLAWSPFLECLKGVDLVSKDVFVMVDQIVKDVVKADNGQWTNLLKKLEEKLNLNNLLEPSMIILLPWIPLSMLSMVPNKLPTTENSTDKCSEKPEVNSGSKVDGAEKTHDKPETNPDHVEENKKPEEYCPTFPDFLAAVIHELTKDPSKETKTDEKPVSTHKTSEPVTEQDKSNKSETLKQPSKEAEIKPAKVEGQVAKVPARLTTKVNVAEDLEKVQIQ